MGRKSIFFRADGNSSIGLGHVIRTLALVQMLKEKFDCHFIINNPSNDLAVQVQNVCHAISILKHEHPLSEEPQILLAQIIKEPSLVILDGYNFDTEYQKKLRDAGNKIICIDDLLEHRFVSDAIINHAPGIQKTDYNTTTYTKLFTGLNFALLRPEFLKAATKERAINKIDKIFLCFGGSDHLNLTSKVVNNLKGLNSEISSIEIVIGSEYRHLQALENAIELQHLSACFCRIHKNLNASEMCKLMSQCNIAIVPSSSILYEVTAVKMPILTGYYTNNQLGIYNGFSKLGLVKGLGDLRKDIDWSIAINSLTSSEIKTQMDLQREYQNGQSERYLLEMVSSII